MSGESIDLSVVLPMRDQVEAARRTLDLIQTHLRARKRSGWEILVVADGSGREACREVSEIARRNPRILLLRNPGPIGCGYASRHGILLARGEKILLATPAMNPPIGLLGEMEQMLDRGHDLIVASPRTPRIRQVPPVRIRTELVSRSVDLSLRLLARRRALQSPVLLHLYRRQAALEIFRRQRLDGMSFALEILYLARRYRYSVIEIPIPDEHAAGRPETDWPDPEVGLRELLRIRMHRLRGDYG